MLNTVEAVKLAEAGRKIRKPNWKSDWYIHWDGKEFRDPRGDVNHAHMNGEWEEFVEFKLSLSEAFSALPEGKKIQHRDMEIHASIHLKSAGLWAQNCQLGKFLSQQSGWRVLP